HRREDTDFYDLTAWSLPLLWDVECYSAADSSQGRTEPVDPATLGVPRADAFAPARVAYLVPWGTLAAPAAVARLMAADVRVHCAARRFTQAGRTYRAGTAIVRV